MIINLEAFLLAITILTLTPGLDTALVIRNTSRAGVTAGYMTSLGICFGLFVHATFSAIGISAILMQSAELFQLIKWAGAAYLIWLGLSSFKSLLQGQKNTIHLQQVKTPLKHQKAFREGFLSNVLNPKTGIFYLAFLPQFINPEYSPLLQSLLMAGIHFIIAMIWQCGLASTLNKAKNLLQSRAFLAWMEGITGTVLLLLGVKLLLEE
ncbi:LysE family translocator [Motilimonas cestriensis]|uniref:LysE family translocator n=1 Tax=Motilimonas cestriensis TaxID=2742685 RepID=A0ABS8W672_9GAMM|nr:LysE family translocator [Motilimonas cestriensis]MCE2594489.1 LysE family translocator [Motilimonas cestriensis]